MKTNIASALRNSSVVHLTPIFREFHSVFTKYGFKIPKLAKKVQWSDDNIMDRFIYRKAPWQFREFKRIGIDIPLMLKGNEHNVSRKRVAIIGEAPNRGSEFEGKGISIGYAYGIGSVKIVTQKTSFYAKLILRLLNSGCDVYLTDVQKLFTYPEQNLRHALIDFEILKREISYLRANKFSFLVFGKSAEHVMRGIGLERNCLFFRHQSWSHETHNDFLKRIASAMKKEWQFQLNPFSMKKKRRVA